MIKGNKKYNIIYADPPWEYKNTTFGKRINDKESTFKESYSPLLRYPCMTLEQIKSLPIEDIVEKDAVLFLWTTGPFMEQATQVIDAWGFQYKTVGFVWIKTTQLSKGRPGSPDGWLKKNLGKWTLSSTEFVLLGTKGSLKKETKNIRQVVMSPIRGHSQKPEVVRERIVALLGDKPRIELFARDKPEGWDVWGNEIDDSNS